ncbi:MAG: PVC-type heme-binding CxxCH protein [Bacteroidota bacterium]
MNYYCPKTHLSLLVGLFFLLGFSACQEQGPRIPNAPEGFEIHPDFKLEAVATEPLVFDPVDMEFDERGEAYVLEMPGYPLRDEESRLVHLIDEDGDGVFDKREVFADSLFLASSFMPYKGGMLVASPPHLLFLKDEDGDGAADKKEVLMEGFRVGNLQHNYNGLTYGLDNWIYAANGGNSGKPYFVGKEDKALEMRGEDFRFDLENKIIERVGESSGGFELAFDNWGRMYETHNLEHISQLVFEGKYLDGLPVSTSHSLANISDHEENGLARIYPIGEQDTRVNHPEQSGYFSGACGISFYGGNAFPEGYNNHVFVADVVLNLIHIDILNDDGSLSVASRNREKVEFLASSDRSFRPVNMATGPDGSFYVLDMHREVIEHPEWIPDELEEKMDLSAGKKDGRIYRIRPLKKEIPKAFTFEQADDKALLAGLSHENQWTRMTAQRLIVEGQKKELLPALKELVQTADSPFGRMHAMWTLQGLGELEVADIQVLLKDKVAGVRENALRASEELLAYHPELAEGILELCKDEHPRVRLRSALVLGQIPDEYFASFARDIFYGLQHMMGQENSDKWSAIAAATAMKKQPLTFARQLLEHHPESLSENNMEALQALCRMLARNSNKMGVEVLITSIATKPNFNSKQQARLLESIADSWTAGAAFNPTALETNLTAMEKGGNTRILKASGKVRKAFQLAPSPQIQKLMAEAKVAVMDDGKSVEERLELLKLMGLGEFEERKASLYAMLDNLQPFVLQEEALQQLWQSDNREVGAELLNLWQDLGPEARKMAGSIMLYKSYNHDMLLTALEEKKVNPGELNLDLERRRVLLWSENDEVKARAEALFSDAGVLQRKEAMAKMRPALAIAGDIHKGEEQFQLLCSTCHQYGELGQEVGPVLTEINRKSKESLMHDILDPNAAVDTKYLNHSIRTKDGNIYTGIIYSENDAELRLRMTGGKEELIAKKNIEKLSSLGISFMPEGLEEGLSPEDMADLLAFLQQAP